MTDKFNPTTGNLRTVEVDAEKLHRLSARVAELEEIIEEAREMANNDNEAAVDAWGVLKRTRRIINRERDDV